MPTKDSTDGIMNSAFRIGRHLRKKMLSHVGDKLHMGHIHALGFIFEHPGTSMKDIAKTLCITSPSATVLMDRLVKQKYVERYHDATNRRLVRLKLTQAGTRMMKQKMAERRHMISAILSTLSADDLKVLDSILKKVLDRSSLSS